MPTTVLEEAHVRPDVTTLEDRLTFVLQRLQFVNQDLRLHRKLTVSKDRLHSALADLEALKRELVGGAHAPG